MSTTLTDIQDRLQKILITDLSQPLSEEQVSSGAPLTGGGVALDSIALLELVVSIENEFDILLDDGSLAIEHFASIEALAKVVETKVQEKTPHAEGS